VAQGETQYVTDVLTVMVRTEPDVAHRIIAMPKSGTPLEVLEGPMENEGREWSRVRLPNDKEGWVLSQFLISGPPKESVISNLRRENDGLSKNVERLSEENQSLKKENSELKNALTRQSKRAKEFEGSYETLKSESKDFIALKTSYEKTSDALAKRTKELETLSKQVDKLETGQTLRWFIAGASIILVGFMIGYLSRRPKRRPSLL
jgi:SH3 domain protein